MESLVSTLVGRQKINPEVLARASQLALLGAGTTAARIIARIVKIVRVPLKHLLLLSGSEDGLFAEKEGLRYVSLSSRPMGLNRNTAQIYFESIEPDILTEVNNLGTLSLVKVYANAAGGTGSLAGLLAEKILRSYSDLGFQQPLIELVVKVPVEKGLTTPLGSNLRSFFENYLEVKKEFPNRIFLKVFSDEFRLPHTTQLYPESSNEAIADFESVEVAALLDPRSGTDVTNFIQGILGNGGSGICAPFSIHFDIEESSHALNVKQVIDAAVEQLSRMTTASPFFATTGITWKPTPESSVHCIIFGPEEVRERVHLSRIRRVLLEKLKILGGSSSVDVVPVVVAETSFVDIIGVVSNIELPMLLHHKQNSGATTLSRW